MAIVAFGRVPGRPTRATLPRMRRSRRPAVESLEDRRLLSNIVINFDDLPAGTDLTDQYHARGSIPTLPPTIIAVGGQAQSGTQVALAATGPGEFARSGIDGQFTNLHRLVQVRLGLPPEPDGESYSLTVTLEAFDLNQNLVAQASATVTSGAGYHTLLSVNSGSADIASFQFGAEYLGDFGIDNLTYDNPEAEPDFGLTTSDVGGLNGDDPGVVVVPGTSASDTIAIHRVNESTGPIEFSAGGLPAGITASFAPNPATADSVTMVLTAADSAAITPYVFPYPTSLTVTGTPKDAAAGTAPRTTQVGLAVNPGFYISSGAAELIADQPLDLSLGVSNSVKDIGSYTLPPITLGVSGMPPGVTASIIPTVVRATSDFGTAVSTLHLVANAGQGIPSNFDLTMTGQYTTSSGQVVTGHFPLQVNYVPPTIRSFSPTEGWTPVSLQAGTTVTIQGTHLDRDLTVEFGNVYAQATPNSVNSDGTAMTVIVPRLATEGPLKLLASGVVVATSSGSFTVRTYRNTDGFSFSNDPSNFQGRFPGVSFDDVTELFGYDQTHLSIEPFWPFSHYSITLPIPDPLAYLFSKVANSELNDGQCFGFSLASQRLLDGVLPLSTFPAQAGTDGSTIWDLADSSALTHYIHIQHIAQLSTRPSTRMPSTRPSTWPTAVPRSTARSPGRSSRAITP